MSARAWPRHGIFKLGNGQGWMVPSAGTEGAYRHVTWAFDTGRLVFLCTCPAGRAREAMSSSRPELPAPCRHVQAVARAEADDGIPPRPAAPVNAAAFVD